MGTGYIQGGMGGAPVLPNTSGDVISIVAVITLAIGVAIVATTVARQLAKKHYQA
ncbi:MAG TPA: hypothetical protein VLA88_05920 [Candidatus Saccharimonadales bacterium]|nr:hypothetical protein [Candidatus Saccharimonadales bacterium]